MGADPGVTGLVDQLIDLFNRRSMDLPDGWFTRHTRFLLNGVPFEDMLGRPPDDPLIRMLTRGAAGYRFTSKAVQHAMPDARLERGELTERVEADGRVVTGQCWLSGHFRGAGEAVDVLATIEMRLKGATLGDIRATLDPADVIRLQEARLRP